MGCRTFFAILLSGGSGTRFAPLSTQALPKQFLNILHPNYTMIQETYLRVADITDPAQCYVSTNSSYVGLVQDQLSQIPPKNIIAEPLKKNTAPPIALISHYINLVNKEAVLLFLPSDHFIRDVQKTREIFLKALQYASENDHLVTFGVPPEFPSSDYGYICFEQAKTEFKKVKKFVEKPVLETAQKYIEEGCYYWNSGMFVWKASVILQATQDYLPDMHQLLQDMFKNSDDVLDAQKVKKYFEEVESISIDYGVMEKAENVVMFPFDAGWSDVGTWKGLNELQKNYQLSLPSVVQNYLDQYRRGELG